MLQSTIYLGNVHRSWTTLLLLCIMMSYSEISNGQVTITSNLVLPVDTTVYRAVHYYPDSNIKVGSVGLNTWDFTSLINEDLDTLQFLDPALTPYASKFSTANKCMVNKDGFTYFRKTAAGLFLVGSALDFIGNGTLLAVAASPELTFIPFPATYLTAYNGASGFSETLAAEDINASNFDSIIIVGNLLTTVEFDAYGTLITPFDTMNVIRQKVQEVLSYDVTGRKYLAGQVLYSTLLASEGTTEVRYLWWADSAGYYYPVVEMAVSLSGTIQSVQFAVSMNVRVGSNFITDCRDSCDAVAVVLGADSSLSYIWSGPDSQITDTIKTLCTGSYMVTVTDTNGSFVRIPFDIDNASAIMASLTGYGASCETCDDGGASIAVSGGTEPYEILWDLNAGSQTTVVASNLLPGSYSITVLDNNECQAFFSTQVGLFQGVRVFPNPADEIIYVFSRIEGTMNFEIYDMRGTLVRKFEYTSSEAALGLKSLSEGHYIYRLIDEAGNELKTDHFSIIR